MLTIVIDSLLGFPPNLKQASIRPIIVSICAPNVLDLANVGTNLRSCGNQYFYRDVSGMYEFNTTIPQGVQDRLELGQKCIDGSDVDVWSCRKSSILVNITSN